MGTALHTRNPYDSKSGQTVSLFVGQILTSEALSQKSMGWQGRTLLINSNFTSDLSVVMQMLEMSLHENTECLFCSGLPLESLTDPLSSLPTLCCLNSGLSSLLYRSFFIQIKAVIINVCVLLLLACLMPSGGSGIWNVLCKCVYSAGTCMSWGKQRNDSSQ